MKTIAWLLVAAIPVVLAAVALDAIGIPPRSLATSIEREATGASPHLVALAQWAAARLRMLERPGGMASGPRAALPPLRQVPQASAGTGARRVVPVNTAEQARKAVEQARPGDVITFSPGTYRFAAATNIAAKQPGAPGSEITVRAERPGTANLEFDMSEGFLVSAPYWIFENLSIRGACADHSYCEHAFHVVAGGTHFVARNNTLVDFNAHFKINPVGNLAPDHGLIEGNILRNTADRRTANPVTPIDLVAASHWTIRGNSISDFVKSGGERISFGAFAKGGGEGNRFEQNLVVCENLLRDRPGQRVGLSFGGGGTHPQNCRDRRCITEQQAGVIESNLIMSCSDDGIYINKAAATRVLHNTLIDTGPIVVRFPESSADVEGNLVDSSIEARDDSILREKDNRTTSMAGVYLGWRPVRRLFADVAKFDLRWNGAAPRRPAGQSVAGDLCGGHRPALTVYGASEDYARCFAAPSTAK